MQHINHNLARIRRRILLRVWYSYIISIVSSVVFGYGLILGGVVAAFGRLTHVAALAHNLLSAPLASLPTYVWQTLTQSLVGGEVLTFLVTLSMVTMIIGALLRLKVVIGGGSAVPA
jgi:hypothetical protein